MNLKTQAALVESAPVIIAFHDTEHRILWANAAYRAATRRTLQEIEGKKCYSVWNLATTCRGCPVTTAMETGENAESELTPENQDHWPDSPGWETFARVREHAPHIPIILLTGLDDEQLAVKAVHGGAQEPEVKP